MIQYVLCSIVRKYSIIDTKVRKYFRTLLNSSCSVRRYNVVHVHRGLITFKSIISCYSVVVQRCSCTCTCNNLNSLLSFSKEDFCGSSEIRPSIVS